MDAFTQKLVLHTNELEDQNRSLTQRIGELEKQARVEAARANEFERMEWERDKAITRAEAAENARAAALRAEQKEYHARLRVEEEVENLKARIVQLQEQPSRLAKLRDEIGV
jgi:hypothetical protein